MDRRLYIVQQITGTTFSDAAALNATEVAVGIPSGLAKVLEGVTLPYLYVETIDPGVFAESGAGRILQAVFANVTSDTTTTSIAYTTLISQDITISAGSALQIFVSSGISNSLNSGITHVRITVDGTIRGTFSVKSNGAGVIGSGTFIDKITGLSAGSRTVLIEWKVNAGTGQVRPIAAPGEYFNLLIQEIS